MKTAPMVFLQLFFLLTLPLGGASAEFNEPHITVYGMAETKAIPDRIIWSLSMKSQGGTVRDTADRHSAEVSELLDSLRESGIPAEDIMTSRIFLQENYVYRNNSRLKDGYLAVTAIQFETADFAAYLEYWNRLTTFANLTIDSVSFDVSNRREIEDATRTSALKDAREKAAHLANGLAVRILGPLLVEELRDSIILPRNTAMAMDAAGASRGASPVAPGKEMIRSEVKVIFRITADQ